MKKAHWFIMALIVCAFQLPAQKKSNFEGTVKYSMVYENSQMPPEMMAMFSSAEMVMYVTPEKQRTDMNMVIQSTTSIVDMKQKTNSTILEMGGKKYLIKMTKEQVEKEEKKAPELKIKYLDETKQIAGYNCKKAEIAYPDAPDAIVNVYFTEDIPMNDVKPVYKGLDGLPLEYTLSMGGMEIKFVAKSVSKEKVADSVFEIPQNCCVETTVEELQKELLKQMGGQ